MHGSTRRGLETERPAIGHGRRSGLQGKPGEKGLLDLPPTIATAPVPDPTPHVVGVVFSRPGPGGGDT